MNELLVAILIGLFTISFIAISVTYFVSILTMLSNTEEDKEVGIVNIFPVFNTDGLNEKGEKTRQLYNKSLFALYIWLIIGYICYKILNT